MEENQPKLQCASPRLVVYHHVLLTAKYVMY